MPPPATASATTDFALRPTRSSAIARNAGAARSSTSAITGSDIDSGGIVLDPGVLAGDAFIEITLNRRLDDGVVAALGIGERCVPDADSACGAQSCGTGLDARGEATPCGSRVAPQSGGRGVPSTCGCTPDDGDGGSSSCEVEDLPPVIHRSTPVASRHDEVPSAFTATGTDDDAGASVTVSGVVSRTARAVDSGGHCVEPLRTVRVAPCTVGRVAACGFEEGARETTDDSSGVAHPGVVTGATGVGGHAGGMLAFDGLDDLVAVPRSPLLDTCDPLTPEARERPDATSGPGRRRSRRRRSACATRSTGATARAARRARCTRGVSGAIHPSTQPLRIGGNLPYGEFFKGRIDDLRVWDTARTQAQIQDLDRPSAVP